MPSSKVQVPVRSKQHRTENNKNKLRNRRRNRNRRNANKGRIHIHQAQQISNKNTSPFATTTTMNSAATRSTPTQPTSTHPASSTTRRCNHVQWNDLYQNAVRWQTQYQASYWKNVAVRQERRYNALLEQFEEMVQKHGQVPSAEADGAEDETANEGANSGDELSMKDAQQEVDAGSNEEYLQFMEISRRHQLQRAMEKADELNNECTHICN